MARRASKVTRRRRVVHQQTCVTPRQLEAVLAIIERNTGRIERLEDVFAMQAKDRAQVKHEINAIKAVLRKQLRRRARR
jgi:hypothetical protein